MSQPQTISILEPMRPAWAHTRRILFEPFDLRKWLLIGFTCFLANLSSYTNGGGNYTPSDTGPSAGDFMSAMHDKFGDFTNAVLVIGAVLVVLLVLLAIVICLAMIWVSCRGTFMFIDNIVQNQTAVSAPWKKFALQGWQLFYFYLLGVGGFIALIFATTVPVIILAEGNIMQWNERLSGIALMILAAILVTLITSLVVFTILVKGMVIPRMYVQHCGVLPALKDSWNLFCRYPLEWIAYLFVNVGLAIASLLLVLMFCVFTCCIGALPYINQVAMLPMYVFLQAYTLFFVAQFGPEWNPFSTNSTITHDT